MSGQIDWKDFRGRCELDFLVVEFELTRPVTGKKLNYFERGVFFQALDPQGKPDNNIKSTWFRATIQNPMSLAEVRRILDHIGARYGLRDEPTLHAMEVSFDIYPRNLEDLGQLPVVAEQLYNMNTMPPSDNRRLQGHFDTSVPLFQSARVQRFGGDATFYVGNKTDPCSFRVYVKKTDKRTSKTDALMLPPEEHRARFEVTLQGAGLPVKTLADLERFKFTALADYFRFGQVITPPLLPTMTFQERLQRRLAQAMIDCDMQPAKRGERATSSGIYRFRRAVTKDVEVNQLAYEKLRELTRRFA